MKTNNTNMNRDGLPPDGTDGALPFVQGDEMDVLLRDWHDANRAKAASGRDRLLAALRAEDAAAKATAAAPAMEAKPEPRPRMEGSSSAAGSGGWKIWRIAPLAAAAVLTLAVLAPFMLPPGSESVASAKVSNIMMCPEGGKLEAYDAGGVLLGACVLEHTDVEAEISGHLARVTLTQRFKNPLREKIEAVYTFPMSHRGAVDRMSMAIGDRVIVGEVKERDAAREIYEQAREAGLVAGLTEQERPNIFTQSVANIEPGATIAVTLSYVEFVDEKDGEFTFSFPTVVGPRYIPGEPKTGEQRPGLQLRRGIVLQGPGSFEFMGRGPGFARSERGPDQRLLAAAINGATPIMEPAKIESEDRWLKFVVTYADGTREEGLYFDSPAEPVSVGFVADRWFALSRAPISPRRAEKLGDAEVGGEPGAAFAPDTDQVPDASRITPMPVAPGTRSGHDLSIRVKIDTGGPGILSYASPLHRTVATDVEKREDGGVTAKTISLEKLSAIPNRDFVLTWKQSAEGVTDQVFTHTGKHGNFFGLMLRPPARVDDTMAVPREMIFVVDTSGSMNGFPIEKSKEVMERALASMREGDTFNVITFAGSTNVLWPSPRPVNAANLAEARELLATKRGSGGTEMMTAINAALEQRPRGDDEVSRPLRIVMFLTDGLVGNENAIIDAVKTHRGTTRVFSFGIGNSVNRFLLDSIATEGGGAAEYVLLESDAEPAVARLTRRTLTPVLTDIRVEFSDNLSVLDIVPPLNNIPDLFDDAPVTILGRYTAPGAGTVTIRGNTAAGPCERTITLSLPERQPEHDTIATMWARAKIDQVKGRDLRGVQNGTLATELHDEIVRLGEQFGIMSEYTSFVAVDKLRVTVAGKPRLVNVPIELPAGTNFEGFFGQPAQSEDELQAGRSVEKLLKDIPEIVRIDTVRTKELRQQAVTSTDMLAGVDLRFTLGANVLTETATAAPPADGRSAGAAPASAARTAAPSPTPPTSTPPPPPAPTSAAPASVTRGAPALQPAADASAGEPMPGRTRASYEPRPTASPRPAAEKAEGSKAKEDKMAAVGGRAAVPAEAAPRNAGTDRKLLLRELDSGAAKKPAAPASNERARSDLALQSRLEMHDRLAAHLSANAIDAVDGLQSFGGVEPSIQLGVPVSVYVAEPERQNQVRMIVPAQQVAIRIGELTKENRNEQARSLSDELNSAAPEYKVGRSMWVAFNETKEPAEVQNKQVMALAAQAKDELETAARQSELHRKLDERLWLFAMGEGVMSSAGVAAGGDMAVAACSNMVDPRSRQIAAQAGLELRDLDSAETGVWAKGESDRAAFDAASLEQGVLVTVLVTSTESAILEQLKAAGMIVEDVEAKARVVVGIVPVGRLAEFALLDCVRRVEPTPAE